MNAARRWIAAVGVALLATSCTGSGPRTAVPPASAASSAAGQGTESPSPLPTTIRPALILTADLRQPPAPWRRVAFIPYGPAPPELGIELPPVHTSVPLVPRSFTVGPDGTFWILDTVKGRVAHYADDGSYLGAIDGLVMDRVHPHPRDLAFWGGRLVVSHELDLAASYREVQGGGLGPDVSVRDSTGRPIGLLYVYPSTSVGLGLSDGYSTLALLGSGPHGIGEILPGAPAGFRLTAGLPVGGAVRLDVDGYRRQSLRLVSTTPSEEVVQPLRIRMRAGRAHPHAIPAIFSEHYEAAAAGAGFFVVQGSPARAGDAQAYGGGRWFLRYPTDGSPLVWGRLPEPALPDEYQVRHLAVDATGDVFLMSALRSGVAIYER